MVNQWGRELVLYLFCLAVCIFRVGLQSIGGATQWGVIKQSLFYCEQNCTSLRCCQWKMAPRSRGKTEAFLGNKFWEDQTQTHMCKHRIFFMALFPLRGDRKHFLHHNEKQRLFNVFFPPIKTCFTTLISLSSVIAIICVETKRETTSKTFLFEWKYPFPINFLKLKNLKDTLKGVWWKQEKQERLKDGDSHNYYFIAHQMSFATLLFQWRLHSSRSIHLYTSFPC